MVIQRIEIIPERTNQIIDIDAAEISHIFWDRITNSRYSNSIFNIKHESVFDNARCEPSISPIKTSVIVANPFCRWYYPAFNNHLSSLILTFFPYFNIFGSKINSSLLNRKLDSLQFPNTKKVTNLWNWFYLFWAASRSTLNDTIFGTHLWC